MVSALGIAWIPDAGVSNSVIRAVRWSAPEVDKTPPYVGPSGARRSAPRVPSIMLARAFPSFSLSPAARAQLGIFLFAYLLYSAARFVTIGDLRRPSPTPTGS